MGSIPLLASTVRPIEQPDVLANLRGLQALRSAQQEQQFQAQEQPYRQQIAQQTAQTGALDLQEKQIALKDQQAMNAAMQQWSTKAAPPTAAVADGTQPPSASALPDYDSLIDLARKNGASFNAIKGLQSSVLDMRDKASTIAKNDAQTGQANANALKTKNGMIIDAMTGVMSLPDDQLVPGLLSSAQQLQQKGLLDPPHMQMAQRLAASGDPAAIRKALTMQVAGMGGFNKIIDDAQKKTDLAQKQGESDPNSVFYNPSASSVAMGTAPGAAQIQAGEVTQAAKKAGAEAAAKQPFEMSLARQRQALSQGDPMAAGQLLVDGDATLSQLKARGSTPEFIQASLNAAKQISGGKYNAQQAEADFKVAESPAQLAFFGSSKSLTDPGGTLDQLEEAGKNLPGGQFPAFNKLADWEKAATGTGPIAKYAAVALGIADDYAKVVGGGVGTDTAREAALKLVPKSASPEGRAAAIEGIRGTIHSQMNSRIGKNAILQRMYGESTGGTGAPTSGFWSQIPGAVAHQ